jgi:two-component system, OmpR family, KDP operon response regulator KdpE
MHDPLILIIEDEPQIRRFLRGTLSTNGYRLLEASTGEEGLRQAATNNPDLIILDLGLPDLDGLEVTRRLREWARTPLIVLSARGQEADKITALDAGADDYLTKPFGMGELLARMRTALRHAAQIAGANPQPVFSVDGLRVDLTQRRVWRDDLEVHLTPIEYKLLTTLVQHAGKVVTQHHLLEAVWGPGYSEETHYLRIYMGHLRRKLESDPARPRYLITEPGVGYRIADS